MKPQLVANDVAVTELATELSSAQLSTSTALSETKQEESPKSIKPAPGVFRKLTGFWNEGSQ